MRLKNIIVSKFNVNRESGLVADMPYVIENTETHERQIATLVLGNEERLVFNVWDNDQTRSVTLTTSNIESYHIYRASSKDGISIQIEDSDTMNDVPQNTINEETCSPTGAVICHRIVDYKNQNFAECCTTGIEKFYEVDSESGVTIIKQFLYKVTREIYIDRDQPDANRDQVTYAIMLPASEKDYRAKGWKIHPMFYDKKNGRYMDRVILGQKHVMDFTHREEDSITIQILSGLQMLYLVEFGLKQNPKLSDGIYAGIQYEKGFIVISNAYANEKNQLVIDDENRLIIIHDGIGYVSRFTYWNPGYDWLFLPEEITKNPTMTNSYYSGPTINLKNIILWGDEGSNNGIFRLYMFTTATSGDEYIVPWEFGE